MLIEVRSTSDALSGALVVVAVVGEVDLEGTHHLCEALLQALNTAARALLVDASEVTVCHLGGARGLLIAAHAAQRRGQQFILVAPSAAILRAIEEIPGAESLTQSKTMAEAITKAAVFPSTHDQQE